MLKKFNIDDVLAGHPPRTNFNVIRLDDRYHVRIARVSGRFPWHRHPNGDEGWLVWKGRLRMDLEGNGSVELGAGEGLRIPKGMAHSPMCLEEGTVVVIFNANEFRHEFLEQKPNLGGFTETSPE